MFRIYLLTFDGYLQVHFQNYSSSSSYSISLWGKEAPEAVNINVFVSTTNNKISFEKKDTYKIGDNVINKMRNFSTYYGNKYTSMYPHESDNTMLFPLLVLVLFTLFVGTIGIHFNQGIIDFDILSKWLIPVENPFHQNLNYPMDWYEFFINAILSVSIALFGLFIAYILYGSVYSSFQNLDLINSFVKMSPKRILSDQIKNMIYNWSYNRGYIDIFYTKVFIVGIRRLAKLIQFFDRRLIDGITNGVGITSFFIGEVIKYMGGGRISSYLFLYISYILIFVGIINFFFLF
jgi:NAD(P)H-quinone oxidoreductase subunit 5